MEMIIENSVIIFTLINFIILYFILRRFLFKPVSEMLSARKNEVDTKFKNAEESNAAAEQYRIESENNLKGSKKEGKTIVETYKKKAEGLSDEIIKGANNEAQQIISRAIKESEREKEKAQSEIKTQVVELAVLLSSKALEKSIDEEEHRRLINDFIIKVGN